MYQRCRSKPAQATGSLILKGPDPVLFLVSDFLLLLGGETPDRCLFHCHALNGTSDVGHDSITQCVRNTRM